MPQNNNIFAAAIWSILCISVPGALQRLSANATRRAAHPRLVMWASVLSFDIFGSHCRFNSVRCQAKDVTHRCCEDLAVWCRSFTSYTRIYKLSIMSASMLFFGFCNLTTNSMIYRISRKTTTMGALFGAALTIATTMTSEASN